MRHLPLISLTFALSASVLIGCGGGASGINSGVDQDKPADEVTDDEAEAICEAGADYLRAKVDETETRCRLQGLVPAGLLALTGADDDELQDACQDVYDTCIEDAPEPEETDCSDANAEASGCDDSVTVGQVETCLEDRVDAGAEAADRVPPCSELTGDKLEELEDEFGEMIATGEPVVEEPESCEVVTDACPGLRLPE